MKRRLLNTGCVIEFLLNLDLSVGFCRFVLEVRWAVVKYLTGLVAKGVGLGLSPFYPFS